MANSIDLITKYGTKAWDKVYQAEACSSVLDGDKDLLKFTGVKTVKIAKFSSTGLNDYRRANKPLSGGDYAGFTSGTSATGYAYGYAEGDAALQWEEFTIKCDRGTQLRIELFDDEETDGLAVAMATKEFSRTKVVPEVDAYVFSKLAEFAGKVSTSTIQLASGMGYNANGPIQALNDAFEWLADNEVDGDQVIFCSNKFYNQLRSTGEVVKVLRQTEYGENVKFTIGEYEGREIIAVPARRFRTLIQLGADGYSFASGSKAIDFMVVSKAAVAHVTKYDKVKVFGPEVVQEFDGYKVNIRIYHDVFVPDNKRIGIYAHVSDTAALGNVLEYIYNPTLDIFSNIYTVPGSLLVDEFYVLDDADAAYATIKAGDNVPAGAVKVIPYQKTGLSADTYKFLGCHEGKVVVVSASTLTIA